MFLTALWDKEEVEFHKSQLCIVSPEFLSDKIKLADPLIRDSSTV